MNFDLPAGWVLADLKLDGAAYRRRDGLQVIVSQAVESDGMAWMHVSLSRKNRLPSWQDVKLVKNLFIGEDKFAYQVLPSRSSYVNIHPFCLHLWHPISHNPIPEFSGIVAGRRSI